MRQALTNAVFFPSAQMKNVRYKPCEMLLNRLRFQLTRIATNYIVPNPRQHNFPPQRYPGWRLRGVGEIGGGLPQSPSPISMTAPARRETTAPIPVHKQNPVRTSGINPAPVPVHQQAIGLTSVKKDSGTGPGKGQFRNKGAPLFLHYTYCLHLLLHERTVTRVRLHLSNLVHDIHAFRDLAERRVLTV